MESDVVFSDLEEEEEETETAQKPNEVNEEMLPLCCDECGENCFKESYFIEEREEDYWYVNLYIYIYIYIYIHLICL